MVSFFGHGHDEDLLFDRPPPPGGFPKPSYGRGSLLRARRERGAAQVVGRRIGAAGAERSGGPPSVQEQEIEHAEGIGEPDRPVVVDVGALETRRRLAPREQEAEDRDRIGQVEAPVRVRITALELRRPACGHARQPRAGRGADDGA